MHQASTSHEKTDVVHRVFYVLHRVLFHELIFVMVSTEKPRRNLLVNLATVAPTGRRLSIAKVSSFARGSGSKMRGITNKVAGDRKSVV